MDLISYALYKKIKKYVDDINSSSKIQSDWNEQDETSPAYVKNKTHYEEENYQDFLCNCNMDENKIIPGFTMPDVGNKVLAYVDGVEIEETVKNTTSNIIGEYKYIGSSDLDTILIHGGTGWCVVQIENDTIGVANPDTTISLKTHIIHKIDDKFVNYDGLVRCFDYYFKFHSEKGYRYNDNGDKCFLYLAEEDGFILPNSHEYMVGCMAYLGFSQVGSTGKNSYFVTCYNIVNNGTDKPELLKDRFIIGTDFEEMIMLAEGYGYVHMTNPNL